MKKEISKTKKIEIDLGAERVRYLGSYLGEIKLGSHIHITDPCYGRDVWCRAEMKNVRPGVYRAYTIHNDENRVQMVMLFHISYYMPWRFFGNWERQETVGVDSGQCGFFDDSIYPLERNDEDTDVFYQKCCEATLSESQEGVIDGAGVVTSSGYGDGSYSYFTNKGNEKTAFLLDYLSESGTEVMKIFTEFAKP